MLKKTKIIKVKTKNWKKLSNEKWKLNKLKNLNQKTQNWKFETKKTGKLTIEKTENNKKLNSEKPKKLIVEKRKLPDNWVN